MSAERKKTCEDRIDKELQSELNDLVDAWNAYQDGDRAPINEHGYGFDYVAPKTFEDQDEGYFRWTTSGGGPSSEFRFYADGDFNPYKIEYRFHDWFDGAGRFLQGVDQQLLLDIFHGAFEPLHQSEFDRAMDER